MSVWNMKKKRNPNAACIQHGKTAWLPSSGIECPPLLGRQPASLPKGLNGSHLILS